MRPQDTDRELDPSVAYDAFVEAGFDMPDFDEITSHKFNVTCPKCSHQRTKPDEPCCTILLDTGGYICHHCHDSGRVKVTDKKGVVRRKIQRKREYSTPGDLPVGLSESAAKWFKEARGISIETLKKMRVATSEVWVPAEAKRKACIFFPYFDGDEFVNYKARDGKKNFALGRDCRLLPWNVNVLKDPEIKEVVIVEGEIDLLSCIEAGIYNVISCPNGANTKTNTLTWLDEYEEYLADKTFIIATDQDMAGVQLREDLLRRLGKDRCKIAEYPAGFKDLNDVLTGISSEHARICILEADYPEISAIVDPRTVKEKALYYMDHEIPRGSVTGRYKKLDAMFSMERGSVGILQGMPNMGKSVLADNLVVGSAANEEAIWGVASWEKPRIDLHAVSLCQQYTMTAKEAMDLEERAAALDWVLEHIRFIDTRELDDSTTSTVLGIMRALVRRYGITHILLDNFMFLDSDDRIDDNNERDGAKMIEISKFAKEMNVFVLVVAHPKKLQERKSRSADSRKEYDAPEGYDLLGSSKLFNLVDVGLTIHGPLGGNYVDVICWKFRNDWAGKQGRVKLRKEYAYRGYSEAADDEIQDLSSNRQVFDLNNISV